MKVAIVHYWLVSWRGGEKVLQSLLDIWPEADVYTHVADADVIKAHLSTRSVRTTFISRLPRAVRWYQRYLPLMPLALEQLDLRGYDLVISSESGPAKGVVVDPHTTHICYCHSPMRYVWDLYHNYRENAGWLTRWLMVPLLHYMRLWDQVSSQRVDHFIANSNFVARRIQKYYRRAATVIHPPVAIQDFELTGERADFYLMVGQLVGYKKADLAVRVFNKLGIPLVIIGDGEMLQPLRRIAAQNVRLMGRQPFDVIKRHYSQCRALVFPGTEDFGIVPLEAMASGKPVVAHRSGGAMETVVEGVTGSFFDDQTEASLEAAILDIEQKLDQFNSQAIRRHAASFSSERFVDEIRQFVADVMPTREA